MGVPPAPLPLVTDQGTAIMTTSEGAGLVIVAARRQREGGRRYRQKRSGWPASSSRRQCEGIRDQSPPRLVKVAPDAVDSDCNRSAGADVAASS